MKRRLVCASAVASALLFGCGRRAGPPIMPSTPQGVWGESSQSAAVTLVFRRDDDGKNVGSPGYVPKATKKVYVGTKPFSFDGPNCHRSGRETICRDEIRLQTGKRWIGMEANDDAQQPTSSFLAEASVRVDVTAGRNVVSPKFAAVPSSIAFPSFNVRAGKAAKVSPAFTVLYASGDPILAGAAFTKPIVVTLSQANSTLKLTGATLHNAGERSTITYDGSTTPIEAVLSVSVGDASSNDGWVFKSVIGSVLSAGKPKSGKYTGSGSFFYDEHTRSFWFVEGRSFTGGTDPWCKLVNVSSNGALHEFAFPPIFDDVEGVAPDGAGNVYVSGGEGLDVWRYNADSTWTDFPGVYLNALTFSGGYLWGLGAPYPDHLVRMAADGTLQSWYYHYGNASRNLQFNLIAGASDGTVWLSSQSSGSSQSSKSVLLHVDSSGTATYYRLPDGGGAIDLLAANGNLYVRSDKQGLFRYNSAGRLLQSVTLPFTETTQSQMTVASDGSVWFGNGAFPASSANVYPSTALARVSTKGKIEEFYLPPFSKRSPAPSITGLAVRPGGFWYLMNGLGSISSP